jgi:hypothetical protein
MTTTDLIFAVLAAILGGTSAVVFGVVAGAIRVALSEERRRAFLDRLHRIGPMQTARYYILERHDKVYRGVANYR